MADTKVSSLTAASALAGTELFYADDGANDVKVTATQVKTWASLAPTVLGGTHTAITGLGIRDTSAAFDLTIAATSSTTLTAGRTLTLDVGNVAHTLALGTTANTITFPNAASGTVPLLNLAQSFTALQTFTSGATISSGVLLVPNGSTSSPSVAIGAANCGLYNSGSAIFITSGSTTTVGTSSTIFGLSGGVNLGFASGSIAAVGADVILSRKGAGNLQFGAADAAVAVAQTLSVQSVVAGTAAANGANWTIIGSLPTGTGTSGDIILQTGVKTGSGTTQGTATTALTIKGETQNIIVASTTDSTTTTTGALQVAGGAAIRKRVFMDGITTSSSVQTDVLCLSSAGEVIGDTVACLASSERFKTMLGPLEDGALAKLSALKIGRWQYNAEGKFTSDDWTRERIGPIAEDVAEMDPRLAGYDPNGRVRSYSTEQLLALTIKAMQELKAQNDLRSSLQ